MRIIFAILLLTPFACFADIVSFKTGGQVEGVITEYNSVRVTVEIPCGVVTFSREDVAGIEIRHFVPPISVPRVQSPLQPKIIIQTIVREPELRPMKQVLPVRMPLIAEEPYYEYGRYYPAFSCQPHHVSVRNSYSYRSPVRSVYPHHAYNATCRSAPLRSCHSGSSVGCRRR